MNDQSEFSERPIFAAIRLDECRHRSSRNIIPRRAAPFFLRALNGRCKEFWFLDVLNECGRNLGEKFSPQFRSNGKGRFNGSKEIAQGVEILLRCMDGSPLTSVCSSMLINQSKTS